LGGVLSARKRAASRRRAVSSGLNWSALADGLCFMPLSQEQKTQLRLSTAEAARALVEDLNYIRDVSKRVKSSRGELRRLSAVIRRILVDDDLGKIAAPRLGKLTIDAPDNKAFYDIEKWARVLFLRAAVRQFSVQYLA